MEAELIAALSAAVSWRVSWGSLGADDGLPRAAIFRVGGLQDHVFAGPRSVTSRVQVDVYAASFDAVVTAAAEISAVLAGYRGGTIKGVFLKNVRDDEPKDTEILARRSLIFSVVHRD